ncbi:MAG: hypothetical protein ACLRSW_14980 [Christensenellaceae bacterium]
MTRVRLARNLSGFPFPDKLNPAQAKEVVRMVGTSSTTSTSLPNTTSARRKRPFAGKASHQP